MYKRITLKVGSNVLTLPDGNPNEGLIAGLVEQIVILKQKGIDVLLVSSGAVASGRKVIGEPKNSEGPYNYIPCQLNDDCPHRAVGTHKQRQGCAAQTAKGLILKNRR